jgi:ribosomal protein S18 acetylase RimI-like enzyme
MIEVSNFPGRAALHSAAPHQQRPALGLILGAGGRRASEGEINDFVQITRQRNIDLGRIMVAEQEEKILWAILPISTPGRTLLLLAPNSIDAEQAESAARLSESVCAQHADCHLAQVLVDPAAATARALYLRLGFIEIAELIYLHAPVRRLKNPPALPSEYWFENYSPATHGHFTEGIRQSYRQSLDCPALNGLRDMEDVILGHQAAGSMGGLGEFDPGLWRVLLHRSSPGSTAKPCGVLLLCRTDHNQGMELVYIGLAPEHRRHGLGTMMVRQALAVAAADHRKRLTLAVDSRNIPALHLYYRHGFAKIASKIALIRDLRPGASPVSAQSRQIL